MRILIAEDDAASRKLLSAVLERYGYEVIATSNGLEAVEVMRQPNAPDLVISDWMMPELDGIELVRRLRTISRPLPPYVIMLTTKGERTDIVAGLEAGADDYLVKPFDHDELRARLNVGRRMITLYQQLLQSQAALTHQATHDALTGVLNRRAILEQATTECTRAARQGTVLSVAMCDIDRFKSFNDTYGHQVGDEVLCAFTRVVANNLRSYDLLGRLGGEEFLILTPGPIGDTPPRFFERLTSAVEKHKVLTRSGELSVTVSIGVASSASVQELDVLLEWSDRALYDAKRQGGNCVVYAPSSSH